MNELCEIGLFTACQIIDIRILTLLVNDVVQAVDIGLDLKQLHRNEPVCLLVDFLSGRGRIFEIAVGEGIEEFNGAIGQDVVDLHFEDAGLPHAGYAELTSIVVDDLARVSDLEPLALLNGLFDAPPPFL